MKLIPTLLAFILALSLSTPAHAKRLKHEAEYQKEWCAQHGGIIEYVLDDGARVDCLLDNYAIEFDFADKWSEAIGQSLMYANATGRNPGIVLIMENPEKDGKYLKRLLIAIHDSNKQWSVWIVTPELIS